MGSSAQLLKGLLHPKALVCQWHHSGMFEYGSILEGKARHDSEITNIIVSNGHARSASK